MFFPVTTKLLTDHLRQEEVDGRDQPTLLFKRQSLCSDGHLRLASLVHGSSAPSESCVSSKATCGRGTLTKVIIRRESPESSIFTLDYRK